MFSKEFPWDPRNNADPEYHYSKLTAGLKEAAATLPRVDAIGGSTAGTLVGKKMGVASLFRAIKEKNPSKYPVAQDMFFRVEKDWGVPFEIYNDGDVSALAGMITMGKKGILGVAMGSSEAVGFIDKSGALTGRITELAFAPVDFNPKAPADEWSGDAGVGSMAFSQQAVNWLAEKYGFKFPKTMKLPERLKVVQAAMEKGDSKALKVYVQIGRFLAHAIPWYKEFYDYSSMMLLGRVTSGLGGDRLKPALHVLRGGIRRFSRRPASLTRPTCRATVPATSTRRTRSRRHLACATSCSASTRRSSTSISSRRTSSA